jgi:hypothetical protein
MPLANMLSSFFGMSEDPTNVEEVEKPDVPVSQPCSNMPSRRS